MGRVKLKNGKEADVIVDASAKNNQKNGDQNAITDGTLVSNMKLIDDANGDDFAIVPTSSRTLPYNGSESSTALLELVDSENQDESKRPMRRADTIPTQEAVKYT